jgi:hypothetical protein
MLSGNLWFIQGKESSVEEMFVEYKTRVAAGDLFSLCCFEIINIVACHVNVYVAAFYNH